nr:HAMP domain-containing protein [Deinococcus humi]
MGVLLAVLVLYLVSARTASSVARLLRNLSGTTAGIAHGEIEEPLPPHAITEVAVLAANLDTMARALISRERERDASLADLSDSEARHRALIAGVPDILLTVNAGGEIRSFKPPVEAGNQA